MGKRLIVSTLREDVRDMGVRGLAYLGVGGRGRGMGDSRRSRAIELGFLGRLRRVTAENAATKAGLGVQSSWAPVVKPMLPTK